MKCSRSDSKVFRLSRSRVVFTRWPEPVRHASQYRLSPSTPPVANAFSTGGVEGLRRYYEACLTGSGHRVKTTLERDRRKTLESEREHFMSIYLGAAR